MNLKWLLNYCCFRVFLLEAQLLKILMMIAAYSIFFNEKTLK